MAVCRELGNFTDVEANDVRKAMGKMYRLGMSEVKKFMKKQGYEQKFLDSCVEKGLSKTDAKKVWNEIITFGGYGFAKNHSAPYSLQAYMDMDRKKYQGSDFYASLLTEDPDKVRRALEEVRAKGLNFLLPDINESKKGFSVEGDNIRIGLMSIKNLGPAAVNEIIYKQPFKNYEDFESRVELRKVNSLRKDSLLGSGAFDCFGKEGRLHWSDQEKRKSEIETLGFAISGQDEKERATRNKFLEQRVHTREEYDEAEMKSELCVGGEVVGLKEITTKKADSMAFAIIRKDEEEYDVTLFPKQFHAFGDLFKEGETVLVYGKKDERGLIAEMAATLDDLLDAAPKT